LDSQVIAGDMSNVVALLDRGAAANRAIGRNALQWAAIANQPDIADLLLKRGAVGTTGPREKTALHYAAEYADPRLSMLKLLIAHGAAPNAQDESGWTPLMWGLQSDPAITAFLLQSGSNPRIQNTSGMTALGLAAQASDSKRKRAILHLLTGATAHPKQEPDAP
jgi:ankyrin repeat protein